MKNLIILLLIFLCVSCARVPQNTVSIDEIVSIVEQNLQKDQSDDNNRHTIDPRYSPLKISNKSITAYEADNLSQSCSNVIYSDKGKLYYLIGDDGRKFSICGFHKIIYGFRRTKQQKELYVVTEQKTFVRDVLNDIQIEDDYVFNNRINCELVGYDIVKEVGCKTAILNQIGYISEKSYVCLKKISVEVFQVYQWDDNKE